MTQISKYRFSYSGPEVVNRTVIDGVVTPTRIKYEKRVWLIEVASDEQAREEVQLFLADGTIKCYHSHRFYTRLAMAGSFTKDGVPIEDLVRDAINIEPGIVEVRNDFWTPPTTSPDIAPSFEGQFADMAQQ